MCGAEWTSDQDENFFRLLLLSNQHFCAVSTRIKQSAASKRMSEEENVCSGMRKKDFLHKYRLNKFKLFTHAYEKKIGNVEIMFNGKFHP
jgi:hypothetical protein